MNKPQIGVVGLGGIAQKAYLPLLSQASEWKLVGAYSPNAQKRERICETYRIDPISSLTELAARCDAVFVHSTTASHYEVVSELLQLGKDVYVDKPLAETLEQAEQLAELSTRLGRKLMVGFNRRFCPLYVEAKQRIEHPAWIRMEKHRSNAIGPETVRATMLDDYLHVVDTVRWLSEGSAAVVHGTVQVNEQLEMLYAQHHYDSGTGFMLSSAMHRQAGTSLEQLEIVGSGQVLRVKNMNVLELEEKDVLSTVVPPAWQTILKQRGFEDAVQHFMQCILQDKKPIVDAGEALKSQQLLMSMLE
ncbi:Gfo/Idh/MocA family protein [Paenibacillus paridis]|uniref:Gfo/Idh/MocA family protein n=1 Tax=Paenibacillus paridis TaxID=2583376 RepID=UPI0011243175|nr:Gfo/Idh/MocA family oxidoreductase [Paenibacillus paridis]